MDIVQLLISKGSTRNPHLKREAIGGGGSYLLLRDVVTRAISLEKPFLSTLTKQINKLIELKNSEAVSDFIARNVAKIKANELAEIERRIKEIKNRRLVVDKIQILVDKIEHASNSVQKELVLV
ncbi:23S rRNA maturation-related 3'-5' exoribonuclease YhaM [Bacillus fengqiuensis]|nr:23S rRNA maturation-related 3'-5' exoribonuclease YhaM [Bacillus fengqiuensis]